MENKFSYSFFYKIYIILILLMLQQNLSGQQISWNLTSGPVNNSGTYLEVYSIATTLNGNVFAGTNSAGVHRSTDMGIMWSNRSNLQFNSSTISYMVSDINGNIYTATSAGLFKSPDYGENWNRMNSSAPIIGYQSIASNNSGLLFAGCYDGIYCSTDSGESWSFSGLDNLFVWVIKIYNDTTVLAGTYTNGLFISTDKGNTWNQINSGLNLTGIIGLAVSEEGYIFAGGNGGIYRSKDWGNTWEHILNINPGWAGVIHNAPSGLLLAGSRGSGIFISYDEGDNWYNINTGLSNLNINAFGCDSMGYFYAGSDSGVYVTSFPLVNIKYSQNYLPAKYLLYQNYPNPFNPSTKISWQSPIGSWQTLKIYDILGNEVATLIDEYKPAGRYEIVWDASGLVSGIYLYKIQAGDFVAAKKLILIK